MTTCNAPDPVVFGDAVPFESNGTTQRVSESEESANGPLMVGLTDTKFFMMYRVESPSDELRCIVGEVDSGTGDITWGTSQQVDTGFKQAVKCIGLDESRVLIGYLDNNLTTLTMFIASISGTVASFGAQTTRSPDVDSFDFKLYDSSHVWVLYNDTPGAGICDVLLEKFDASASSLASSGVVNSLGNNDLELRDYLCLAIVDSSTGVIVSRDFGQDVDYFMMPVDFSGNSATYRTAQEILLTQTQPLIISSVGIADGTFVLTYDQSTLWYMTVGHVTASGITTNNYTPFGGALSPNSNRGVSIAKVSDERVICAWGGFGDGEARVYDVSGDEMTGFTAKETWNRTGTDMSMGGTQVAYLSPCIFVVASEPSTLEGDQDEEVVVVAGLYGTTTAAPKALGVSIGRYGGGTVAWVTTWASGTLYLEEWGLTTLTRSNQYSLGACTEAELDAGTYAAWPFAFNDSFCYVFGRLPEPDGLSGVHHVVYHDGTDFTAMENGWGSDICGALFAEADGTVTAIRNRSGNPAQLYRGDDSGLVLKCTLSFDAGVNPHAIDFDAFSGRVFLGADNGVSPIVITLAPPYSTGDISDLTGDHATDEGIVSVVRL